jgi:serine/threonine protein kinase
MCAMTNTQNLTLDTLLGQTSLPAEQSLRYALQLALTMRSAHQNGLIYGVLYPSRISFDGDQTIIETAASEFSPYTAPEVLAGGQPDIRSDIYAFGAIVYHLLSGRRPFPGGTPAEISDAQCARPDPLCLTSGDQLPELERVIFRCLEHNPDRRWPSLRLVCTELRLLSAAAARLHPAPRTRSTVETQLREHISRVELILDSHIATSERSLAEVRDALAETRQYLRTAFDFAEEHLRAQAITIDNLQIRAAEAGDLVLRMTGIEGRLTSQAESVEGLQLVAERTDDLLERVVESIDSLQSFVLGRIAEAPLKI